MSDEQKKVYETPVLVQVCEASELVLGATSGVPDQPLNPPTRLNGDMMLGFDD